jgi:hypothetical protein
MYIRAGQSKRGERKKKNKRSRGSLRAIDGGVKDAIRFFKLPPTHHHPKKR